MDVVIEKSVHFDDNARHAECPFCRTKTLTIGEGGCKGQWFYHCFACQAGGRVAWLTRDGAKRSDDWRTVCGWA